MTTDSALFGGYEPPETPDGLSAGGRLRVRQQQDVTNGRHPLTGGRLHPDASRDRTARSGAHDRLTCGTCVHRVATHGGTAAGGYPKCDAFGPKALTHSATTDVRAWWPACTSYEQKD